MKKIIIAALVFVPATLLTTSCSVYTHSNTGYQPRADYVYSAGYYGARPWGNTYSVGWGNRGWGNRGWSANTISVGLGTSNWGNGGYWRGYRGVSTRGWFGGW